MRRAQYKKIINNNKFKHGEFIPINSSKYKGVKPIFYRSSYELKFMQYCDSNPFVIEWGSESNVIPYKSPKDGKIHRYFVDNYVVYKINNKIYKFLIEIKPYGKLCKPKASQGKRKSTLLQEQYEYYTNLAKWEAAKNWAESKGFIFKILTEKELFKK